ncbi:MAG: hypothetical protein M1826_001245 [Phylliscum demangeonii]|nr:MAG: hypothetical protein M1826_001245 [Phylliscum demangeonii]
MLSRLRDFEARRMRTVAAAAAAAAAAATTTSTARMSRDSARRARERERERNRAGLARDPLGTAAAAAAADEARPDDGDDDGVHPAWLAWDQWDRLAAVGAFAHHGDAAGSQHDWRLDVVEDGLASWWPGAAEEDEEEDEDEDDGEEEENAATWIAPRTLPASVAELSAFVEPRRLESRPAPAAATPTPTTRRHPRVHRTYIWERGRRREEREREREREQREDESAAGAAGVAGTPGRGLARLLRPPPPTSLQTHAAAAAAVAELRRSDGAMDMGVGMGMGLSLGMSLVSTTSELRSRPRYLTSGVASGHEAAAADRYIHRHSLSHGHVALDLTIKYLHQVRDSDSNADSLKLAVSSGILDYLSAHGCLARKPEADMVYNTRDVAPPAETCWLRVGSVFAGTQHAAGAPGTFGRRPTRTPRAPPPAADPRHDHVLPPGAAGAAAAAPPTAAGPPPPPPPPPPRASFDRLDQWPVRVTIHSVDYERMQLCGAMEAFDVPDRGAPDVKTSITTYLEGEIIDFHQHSLETKNFRASPRIDAIYWRKLLPFRLHDEVRTVEKLLSREFLTRQLFEDVILMRWKEKCFVTPSDQALGLTISGFYYISLRRSDGSIEGLYYDPASTPYQHLVLAPAERTFPTFEFR